MEGNLVEQVKLLGRPDVAGVVSDGQAQGEALVGGQGGHAPPASGQPHCLVAGRLSQGDQGQSLAEDDRRGQQRRLSHGPRGGAAVDPGLLQPAEADGAQQLQPGRGLGRADRVELLATKGDDLEVSRGRVVQAVYQDAAREEGGQRRGNAGDGRLVGGVGLGFGQPTPGGADAFAPTGGQHQRRRPPAADQRVVGGQGVGGVGEVEEGLHGDDCRQEVAREPGAGGGWQVAGGRWQVAGGGCRVRILRCAATPPPIVPIEKCGHRACATRI